MKQTFELIVIIMSLIGLCRCGDGDITSSEPIEPEGTITAVVFPNPVGYGDCFIFFDAEEDINAGVRISAGDEILPLTNKGLGYLICTTQDMLDINASDMVSISVLNDIKNLGEIINIPANGFPDFREIWRIRYAEGTGIICKFLKNNKVIYVRIYIQRIEVDINNKWTKVTVKYQYPFIPK
jgi:hypothetical protein